MGKGLPLLGVPENPTENTPWKLKASNMASWWVFVFNSRGVSRKKSLITGRLFQSTGS